MKTRTAFALAAVLLLASAPRLQAADTAPVRHPFVNSGAAAAQAPFARGLYLLHNFEYADAYKAFAQAAAADPGFALAYWGEALSFNHTLWMEQDTAAARASLAHLGATRAERIARAPTARERAYLGAVEDLYGEGDKGSRDAAYSSAMGALARAWPEDLDARSLYSLSLLGLSNGQRNAANYMHAAAEAQAVLDIDPDHPGALHYLIHCFDDPVHAPLALRAARRYGEVAPDAEHALHMPSHIYFALGLWDDAIDANAHSVHASHSQGDPGYHALAWLLYARLQKGQRAEAAELLHGAAAETAASKSREGRLRLAYLRAIWLAETDADPDSADGQLVPSEGIAAAGYFAALDYVRGLGHLRRHDLAAARADLASLGARLDAARHAPTVVATAWFDHVSADEITEVSALARALEGAIAFNDGQRDEGIRQVRAAIRASDALEFEYGPPWSAKPLEELLGELLAEAGRPAEAREAFQRSLAVYPNRTLTLAHVAALPAGSVVDKGSPVISEAALVGTWQLRSIEVQDHSGRHPDPFYGTEVTGRLVYDANGQMEVQIVNLPRAATALPAQRATAKASAADQKARAASFDRYYAYYGRWTLDVPHATVRHHVERALYASEDGADYEQQVELRGNELVFRRTRDTADGPVTQLKVWERAEP